MSYFTVKSPSVVAGALNKSAPVMVKHSPNALLWKGESETVYTFSEELTVVPSSYPFTACPIGIHQTMCLKYLKSMVYYQN